MTAFASPRHIPTLWTAPPKTPDHVVEPTDAGVERIHTPGLALALKAGSKLSEDIRRRLGKQDGPTTPVQ